LQFKKFVKITGFGFFFNLLKSASVGWRKSSKSVRNCKYLLGFTNLLRAWT